MKINKLTFIIFGVLCFVAGSFSSIQSKADIGLQSTGKIVVNNPNTGQTEIVFDAEDQNKLKDSITANAVAITGLNDYINEQTNDLYDYIDTTVAPNIYDSINDESNNLYDYIDNTVATDIYENINDMTDDLWEYIYDEVEPSITEQIDEKLNGIRFLSYPDIVWYMDSDGNSVPYKEQNGGYVLSDSYTGKQLLQDTSQYDSYEIEGWYYGGEGADTVFPFKTNSLQFKEVTVTNDGLTVYLDFEPSGVIITTMMHGSQEGGYSAYLTQTSAFRVYANTRSHLWC